MGNLKNWRTAALAGWIIISAAMLLLMPDLETLVREKGQVEAPAAAQSTLADEMIADMKENGGDQYSIIAVFTNIEGEPLTESQQQEIAAVIDKLRAQAEAFGIEELSTHLDNEQLAKQLISEDGTTILAQLAVNSSSGTISEVAGKLNPVVKVDGVATYLTGPQLVMEDFVQSTQDGIHKTEIIAVIFILAVLIIVFRSPIVPVVSLITVGVSYLVSLGIITQLVEHFNYPFSNFTQVFLVIILFGIGTDYNILLYTRFKEELSKNSPVLDAVRATYRAAGKTVIYSGLAVFIGFMALILAEFRIYQSSSAVAIGVAVLIAVLMTLNPFFMAVLGKKLFWPVQRFEGHGESRLWGTMARFATGRPFAGLILSLALVVPFIVPYTGMLNYNDLVEINDEYSSKQGINAITEHYPAGLSSPVNIAIQAERPLDNAEDLQALDELAAAILRVEGVSAVYSATRPEGELLSELYIDGQVQTLQAGLEEAGSGVGSIHSGLSSAEEKLGGAGQGTGEVEQLIAGTDQAKAGAEALEQALGQLAGGIGKSATGAGQLQAGLQEAKGSIAQLTAAVTELHAGYGRLENGLQQFSGMFSQISQAVEAAQAGYAQIEQSLQSLLASNPELEDSVDVQTALQTAVAGKEQLLALVGQLNEIVPSYGEAMKSFEQANGSLLHLQGALQQIEAGLGQLDQGATGLHNGLDEANRGAAQIADESQGLTSGLAQISQGQQQLLEGLDSLGEQVAELQSGLQESTAGLEQVQSGLNNAQQYLAEVSGSGAARKFYIPQEVLEGEDFGQALDMYMSADRNAARIMVVLDMNPYSREAMDVVVELDKQVQAAASAGGLNGAKLAIGGKTMQNVDLQAMANNDFQRTAVMMLAGIGIVLLVITRSLWQPVLIIASLLLAYGAALGVSELATVHLLGVDSLGWNVPFFGFIMIVALGVDYSIFLMERYRENKVRPAMAIVEAAKNIGGVVISAAIILGGTFAALMPSGVLTLIEVAMVVIVGLFVLSFVLLPVFLPAAIGLADKLSRKKEKS